MQVWNVLHTACWKYRTQKMAICTPPRNLGCIFATKARMDNRKKNLLNSNISPTSSQYGGLRPTSGWDRFVTLGHPGKFQRVSRPLFRYCSDIAQRKPTKLCTIFGHLLHWYTIYTFLGALAPWQNFARCKIHLVSKSCILLHFQCYCMTLSSGR